MNKTLVTFVRHGENMPKPDKNAWHAGPKLNANGRKQAEKTARFLAPFPFDIVLSSDMNRAKETAEIICGKQKKVSQKKILHFRELAEHDEIVYGYTRKLHVNAELQKKKAHQAIKFFKSILKKYQGKRILISAHGNVMRACFGSALGFSLHESPELNSFNCSLLTMAFRKQRLTAIFHVNLVDHLGEWPFHERLKSVNFISDYSKLVDGENFKKEK